MIKRTQNMMKRAVSRTLLACLVLFAASITAVGQASQPFKAGIVNVAYDEGSSTATVEVRIKADTDFTGGTLTQVQFFLRAAESSSVVFGDVTSGPFAVAKGTGPNDCGTAGGFKYCYYNGTPTATVDFAAGVESLVATISVVGALTDVIELAVYAFGDPILGVGGYYVEYAGVPYYYEGNTVPENEFYVTKAKLGAGQTYLPVELSSFAAVPVGGAMRLDWVTDSENNNAGFEVERSMTGERFEQIGYVEGAGTTLERHSYSFYDAVIPANVRTLYYRLKQIDFDGQSQYSPMIEVSAPTPQDFRLEGAYPNPFNGRTVISYQLPDQQHVSLRVFDALGREVKTLVDTQQSAGRYAVPFDAAGLTSGLYIFQIEAGQYVDTARILYVK